MANPFAKLFRRPPMSIRLAELAAGQRHDPLRISILTVDASETKYDCISYDRSNKDVEKVEIHVQDEAFSIPRPLETALRTLRRTDQCRHLWADLLIGSTPEERSAEAAVMTTVIENADKVIAWLGPADGKKLEALDVLRELASRWHQARLHTNFPENSNHATPKQMMDAYTHVTSKSIMPLKLSDQELWTAVQDIVNHTYFETTQSISEVLLAKEARITIGESSISFGDFFAASMGFLNFVPHLQIPLSPRYLDAGQRILRLEQAINRKRKGESLELFPMMKDARRTSYNDAREIVFSVLPIITPSGRTKDDPRRPSAPKADYSKTTEEVFKEASKYIMEERQDVMMWWYERPPCSRKLTGLPSWVNDWSLTIQQDGGGLIQPVNGLREWADPLDQKRIYVDAEWGLHVQAHALDRVARASPIFTEDNCRKLCLQLWQSLPTLPGEEYPAKCARMWRSLVLNLDSGMADKVQKQRVPPDDVWESFFSMIAEERILELSGLSAEQMMALDAEQVRALQASNEDIRFLSNQVGRAQRFEELLRRHAMGRRFFYTEQGRTGMSAVEALPPGVPAPRCSGNADDAATATSDGGQPPVPTFEHLRGDPLLDMMLAGFHQYVAGQNPDAARFLSQAMDGVLPGQRPAGLRTGDLVVAIVGGFQPYIVRPVRQPDDPASTGGLALGTDDRYNYVGDCYLHGVMDGEPFRVPGSTRFKTDVPLVDIVIV